MKLRPDRVDWGQIVQDGGMPYWLMRSFCTLFGHRFGAPRSNGMMMCGRCGILAYGVPVSR
ncbi:MAG: hypothetical protein ABI276_07030 [Acidimicrobiales bacterium]